MKKYIFTLLTIGLLSFYSQAQTGLIRGALIDSDFQDPVPFANIVVKETGTGTTSDFDGNYELELVEGIYTIVFSFIGYETVEVKDVNVKLNEAAIVAAASLAHDIGNPPFGHSGEMAIGDFFKNGEGVGFKESLSEQQYEDLCNFEGNANGFKIISENKAGIKGGLRLSYATLGAFTKYPRKSILDKKSDHIKDKKFGFFHSQNTFFDEVANELGMVDSNGEYIRHPLAYLVEAADDICYTLIDFEDGINLGWISEEYALEFLIRLVKDSIDTKKYNSLKHKTDRVAYLRALSVNTLINDTVKIFLKNEEKILNGEFTKTLLSESVFKAQMEDIIDISVKKVYNSKEVIEKELKGYQVIHKLLSVFIKAAVNNQSDNTTALDDLVLASLPKTYIHKEGDLYNQLLDISCFVASLTDGNALEWYNKIS
jgi:dGTPase